AGGRLLLAGEHTSVLESGRVASYLVALDRDHSGEQRHLRGRPADLSPRAAPDRSATTGADGLSGSGVSGFAAIGLAEPGSPRLLSGAESLQFVLLHVHRPSRRAPD